MYKIAVCDDQPDHLTYITSYIEKLYPNSVRGFLSWRELEAKVSDKSYIPDILILDIELGGINGIRFAKHLNELIPETKIIFLTGYLHYATDAYAAQHFWFVTKDQMEERLGDVLRKAILTIENENEDSISFLIKGQASVMKIKTKDIFYLERQGRTTEIVTDNQTYQTSMNPLSLISKQMEQQFIHCHQSYWVNVNHIRKMTAESFLLDNNQSISITRTYRTEARQKFFETFF